MLLLPPFAPTSLSSPQWSYIVASLFIFTAIFQLLAFFLQVYIVFFADDQVPPGVVPVKTVKLCNTIPR